MLKGKKVTLHLPEEKHLKKMLEWRNDPNLRQFFREYRELSYEHQVKWWKDKALSDDSWQYFVMKPNGEDKIIGVIGLVYIHPIYKTAEFAISIGDENYRNGGFGSDALRTIIKYGFEELNLNRIWCEVYSNNKAIDVYRHIGFKDEGLLRQTVYKNGQYHDSYILGMLKDEWQKTK
jgi:hypothetical protein